VRVEAEGGDRGAAHDGRAGSGERRKTVERRDVTRAASACGV
jgi:hypothetical protein